MKPRVFIGSSSASLRYAAAIHASLTRVAECTVWTNGAFELSASTVEGLKKNLRDSDFGIFVFAPDDVATIKGDLLKVPRDNVVYEAGLFSGYLCPERCFLAVPESTPVHLPTDLLGITVGHYEDARSDGNSEAAVAPFCFKVEQQIEQQGLFLGIARETLQELSTKFECCQWIVDESSRVERKKMIAAEIDGFCATHPVNKHRLLARHQSGHYIALLSAIRNRPEKGDCALIMQMHLNHLPHGFAYGKLMDAAEAIKLKRACSSEQIADLAKWLDQLPNKGDVIANRIFKFATS